MKRRGMGYRKSFHQNGYGNIVCIVYALLLVSLFVCLYGNMSFAEGTKKELPSGISYEEIGHEIEAYVEENKDTTCGMEVAVFDREGIIYSGSFGYLDMENKVVADENSVFEWGSVTKTFVWVSVMQLWEQGKLDLEEDIRNYLPENFLRRLKYDTPVTMLHLMNHNAGFQEMTSNMYYTEDEKYEDLGKFLQEQEPPQVYEPGTVNAYSNWGTGLAAYIVERISGQMFDDYVKEHIFEPLGMEHSAISSDLSDNPWVKEQRSKLVGYETDGSLRGSFQNNMRLYPVGRCTGTLEDLASYGQAFLPKEGEKCLLFDREDTLKEMFTATSYYGDTNVPYNCHGWWTEQYAIPVIGHGGNSDCCSSSLAFDPDSGIGVVVLVNQYLESTYNEGIKDLVFGSYGDSPLYHTNESIDGDMMIMTRTYLKGPNSIANPLMEKAGKADLENECFFVYDQHEDGSYLYLGGGEDFMTMTAVQTIAVLVTKYLYDIPFYYAVLALIVMGGSIKLAGLCRAKKLGQKWMAAPFEYWNDISCGLMLVWYVNSAIAFSQAQAYAQTSRYAWQFGLNGILALAMCVMILQLIVKWRKQKGNIKAARKCVYIVTAVSLLIVIVITLYWQQYQFWLA